MSVALVNQLNFEKQIPIDGNCKQKMTVAVLCTGAGSYNLGTYFMINLPTCGPDYVLDGANSFLRFQNLVGLVTLTLYYFANSNCLHLHCPTSLLFQYS